jgi:hypothetical protein
MNSDLARQSSTRVKLVLESDGKCYCCGSVVLELGIRLLRRTLEGCGGTCKSLRILASSAPPPPTTTKNCLYPGYCALGCHAFCLVCLLPSTATRNGMRTVSEREQHDAQLSIAHSRVRSLIVPRTDVAASHKTQFTTLATSSTANKARSPSSARCAPRDCPVGTS